MKFTKNLFLFIAITVALEGVYAAERPNIVVILADDMGHGFVSCLYPKSKIQTPNIDRLAREGIEVHARILDNVGHG